MKYLSQLGEFSVLWPRMLWLLALLPLLIVGYLWLVRRQRRIEARLAALTHLNMTATGGALARHGAPLLFLVGLCALFASVSRPQAVVVLPSMQKNVILAIDTSGSMRATDVKPNRLGAAQAAARTFIENQPQHSRIGIVSIAGNAAVVQSPTDNRGDLMKAIERLQLQPGTALGSGIYVALAALLPDAGIDVESLTMGRTQRPWFNSGAPEQKSVPPGSNRSVAIVLLSDGQNTHGPDPAKAAKLAAQHGVRIYTVGIGTPEGTTLGFSGWSMRVRLDEQTLKNVAATTYGEYYAASSARQLKTIYERLSARMVVERGRTIEVTALLIGVGALLLAISALTSILRFNRVL
ncbi:MAG TPA: VWA domain-containing protein [Burkholderiales bacterium]|nr:VWA domain-containing protein [Burkholderiales bacterium]